MPDNLRQMLRPPIPMPAHFLLPLVSLLLSLPACSNGGSEQGASAVGESCTKTSQCKAGLVCAKQVCAESSAGSGDSYGADGWGEADLPFPSCYPECTLPVGIVWIAIPGGTFEMGCSPDDNLCDLDEVPVHIVSVAPFELFETEVTEFQFKQIMWNDPSCDSGAGGGPNSPVECVTWYEAVAFCEAIGGRLPTEAEWEYAARGGTTTRFYCGDDLECVKTIGWYGKNAGGEKHDIKGRLPNAYGLYDMVGNVKEFLSDWYHESYDGAPDTGYPPWTVPTSDFRGLRGGGFASSHHDLRSSARSGTRTTTRARDFGFRCARSISH